MLAQHVEQSPESNEKKEVSHCLSQVPDRFCCDSRVKWPPYYNIFWWKEKEKCVDFVKLALRPCSYLKEKKAFAGVNQTKSSLLDAKSRAISNNFRKLIFKNFYEICVALRSLTDKCKLDTTKAFQMKQNCHVYSSPSQPFVYI